VRRVAIVAAVLCTAACSREPALRSCADRLAGVWHDPAGRRWALVDRGAALEIYPLFDDSRPEGDPRIVVAPRWLELSRAERALTGTVHRIYMRGADACEAAVPVRVTSCAGSELELELADPTPPTAFAPCAWVPVEPARTERWRRD
jgi:hypothetical protein